MVGAERGGSRAQGMAGVSGVVVVGAGGIRGGIIGRSALLIRVDLKGWGRRAGNKRERLLLVYYIICGVLALSPTVPAGDCGPCRDAGTKYQIPCASATH